MRFKKTKLGRELETHELSSRVFKSAAEARQNLAARD